MIERLACALEHIDELSPEAQEELDSDFARVPSLALMCLDRAALF